MVRVLRWVEKGQKRIGPDYLFSDTLTIEFIYTSIGTVILEVDDNKQRFKYDRILLPLENDYKGCFFFGDEDGYYSSGIVYDEEIVIELINRINSYIRKN